MLLLLLLLLMLIVVMAFTCLQDGGFSNNALMFVDKVALRTINTEVRVVM